MDTFAKPLASMAGLGKFKGGSLSERYGQAKNVLFIGAGASYGARIDTGPCIAPPLGDHLLKYLCLKLDACLLRGSNVTYWHQPILEAKALKSLYDFFQNAFAQGSTYEIAVTNLIEDEEQDERLDLLDNINRFLALSFSNGDRKGGMPALEFEKRRDLYDQLIQKIKLDSSWAVISLNYDLLFEQAAMRHGLEIYYPEIKLGALSSSNPSRLHVLKPHGSINWFGTIDQPAFTLEQAETMPTSRLVLDEAYDMLSHESVDLYACRPEDVLENLSSRSDMTPVMAHFATGKYTFRDLGKLRRVRQLCIQQAANAERVIVLGVRLPEDQDDSTVSKIFDACAEKKKSVEYINCSEGDCMKVGTVCKNAKLTRKSFRDWVEAEETR